MKKKEGKKGKHGIFWLVWVRRLDYHSVRSFKPNLAISYEMDNNWGWNHEINAKV